MDYLCFNLIAFMLSTGLIINEISAQVCPPNCQCSSSRSRVVCCLWSDQSNATETVNAFYSGLSISSNANWADLSKDKLPPISWCQSLPKNHRTSQLACQSDWQHFSIHLTPGSWPPLATDPRKTHLLRSGNSTCLQTLRSLTITGTEFIGENETSKAELMPDSSNTFNHLDYKLSEVADNNRLTDRLVRLTSRDIRIGIFLLSGQLELRALTVQRTQLSQVEPGFIDQLEAPYLREIQLIKNRFLTSEGLGVGWLGGLRGLQLLDLNGNSLDSVQLARWGIPSDLTSQMTLLDLSHNRISLLEADTFRLVPKLIKLHLQGNRLTGLLTSTFRGLSNLRFLDLSYNQLTMPGLLDLHEVGESVRFSALLPRLRQLRLSGNPLTKVPARQPWWLSVDCPRYLTELHLDNIGDLQLPNPILPSIAWTQCPDLGLVSLVQPYRQALNCLPRTWLGLNETANVADISGLAEENANQVMLNLTFHPIGLSVCPVSIPFILDADLKMTQSDSAQAARDQRFATDESPVATQNTLLASNVDNLEFSNKQISLADPVKVYQPTFEESNLFLTSPSNNFNNFLSNGNQDVDDSENKSSGILDILTNLFPSNLEEPNLMPNFSDSQPTASKSQFSLRQRRNNAFRSFLILILLSISFTLAFTAVVLVIVVCSRRLMRTYKPHKSTPRQSKKHSVLTNFASCKSTSSTVASAASDVWPFTASDLLVLDDSVVLRRDNSLCQQLLLPNIVSCAASNRLNEPSEGNSVIGLVPQSCCVVGQLPAGNASNGFQTPPRTSSRLSGNQTACYLVTSDSGQLSSTACSDKSYPLPTNGFSQPILTTFTTHYPEASQSGLVCSSNIGERMCLSLNQPGTRNSLLLPVTACRLSPTLPALSDELTHHSAVGTSYSYDYQLHQQQHILSGSGSPNHSLLSGLVGPYNPTYNATFIPFSTQPQFSSCLPTNLHATSSLAMPSQLPNNLLSVTPLLTSSHYPPQIPLSTNHLQSGFEEAPRHLPTGMMVRSLITHNQPTSTTYGRLKVFAPKIPRPSFSLASPLLLTSACAPSSVHHHYPHQSSLVRFTAPQSATSNPTNQISLACYSSVASPTYWSSLPCSTTSLTSLGSANNNALVMNGQICIPALSCCAAHSTDSPVCSPIKAHYEQVSQDSEQESCCNKSCVSDLSLASTTSAPLVRSQMSQVDATTSIQREPRFTHFSSHYQHINGTASLDDRLEPESVRSLCQLKEGKRDELTLEASNLVSSEEISVSSIQTVTSQPVYLNSSDKSLPASKTDNNVPTSLCVLPVQAYLPVGSNGLHDLQLREEQSKSGNCYDLSQDPLQLNNSAIIHTSEFGIGSESGLGSGSGSGCGLDSESAVDPAICSTSLFLHHNKAECINSFCSKSLTVDNSIDELRLHTNLTGDLSSDCLAFLPRPNGLTSRC